jgi:AcrR family transcriptional regulator
MVSLVGQEPLSSRESLLVAAREAMLRGDWDSARMADVAAAAGVSRQTLYNEFGSKDALAQQLAVREVGVFLQQVESVLGEHRGTPAQAVGQAVLTCLQLAAEDPLVKAALTGGGPLLPFLTVRGEQVLFVARDHIASHMADHWPDLNTREVREIGDIVVRLTVSHIVLPEADPDHVAAQISHLVERLLASSPGGSPS